MLAPSVGGVPVPITQMSMDELFVAATSQPKMETSAVIDSEFRLAFDNVMMREGILTMLCHWMLWKGFKIWFLTIFCSKLPQTL